MALLLILALLMATTAALTGLLRRYALAHSVIDIPNSRSSHSTPTPRGGGVAIVLTFLLVLPCLAMAGWLAWPLGAALVGAGVLIALVGFLDDHGHIAARWRLMAHFLGAGWVLYWLVDRPTLLLFGVHVELGWVGYVFFLLLLVWLLNLYNFMDGIDGLASLEAITLCLSVALLYLIIGQPLASVAPLSLAAVVAGFLFWNFPPAKIFMGDAGSGFLGITLGALMLQGAALASEMLWAWLILLGVFMVDATFTLLRRMLHGEKVYEAHRTHAYQYASRRFNSHRKIALAVLLINALWLLPWACCVALGYVDGLLATVIAYVPLVGTAFWLGAGVPERATP